MSDDLVWIAMQEMMKRLETLERVTSEQIDRINVDNPTYDIEKHNELAATVDATRKSYLEDENG